MPRIWALSLCAALLLGAPPLSADDGFDQLTGHGGPIKGVTLSPDGALAATSSFDYAAGIWSMADGSRRFWLDGHDAAVNAAAFTPDGARLLTAGDDFDLILWDVATGALVRRMEGHRGKLLSVAISPDSRIAASAGWDGWVGLWDLETGEKIAFLKGHKANVNGVAFSDDGSTLWSASYDGTVRRWNVAEKRFERIEVSHGFGVNLIVVNDRQGWLAYGALDGAVRVIHLATGAEVADVTAGRKPVLGLALSRDGSRMAIGDGEGFIHVVSTTDWSTIKDFRAAARGPVWALAFDDQGGRLLAGGLDDHVAVWPIDEAVSVEPSTEPYGFHLSEGLSNGERQFARKCSICHTLTPDTARRAGPTLYGLFGRRIGTVPGYVYSAALATSDLVWTPETLDRLFDIGPEHYTPGTKMPMQRITQAEDRADLIAFLQEATRPKGEVE